MPVRAPAFDPERLLAEDAFVRGLARSLLRDEHAAEDLAQQTWVAALQSRGDAACLRSWLAAVMQRLLGRSLRAQRRLAAREQAAVRQDVVPSSAEIVAREAARAQVVGAVLDLSEPYRAVVLLRFFDHLPPRAIARRLGLPTETVRTRLKRALATLRARLDEHAGERRAWAALLLPFTGVEVPALPLAGSAVSGPAAVTALPITLTGALLMTTKSKVASAAVIASLLVLGWFCADAWLGHAAEVPLPQPAPAAPVTATLGAEATPAAPHAEATAEPARDAAELPVAPTTGSVMVRAVWADDRTPAADVLVEIHTFAPDGLFDHPRARTDANGIVRFDGVPARRVAVRALRATTSSGMVRVAVEAGVQAEVELPIAMGMTARGSVVDGAGRPVAGAEVVVADWGGGIPVVLARSATDGTFLLRAIGTHCHIGARARGFAPSSLRRFTAGDGAEMELTIALDAPGAELRGTVQDRHGQPVAGAVVQAGSAQRRGTTLPDGAQAMLPLPERTRTDEHGRFAFASVVPGALPVAVRARGHAGWRGEVEVQAGRASELVVRLPEGATLSGIVRDGGGRPLAGVRIGVGDPDDLCRRSARSLDDGTYAIDALAPGELDVRFDCDTNGRARKTVHAVSGERVRLDVALGGGLALAGRVIDEHGKPVRGAMVEADRTRHVRGEPWHAFENTDADGRFTLPNCAPGVPLRITVRRRSVFPEKVLTEVLPERGPLVVELPREAWVRIRGRVLDPEGRPVAEVGVSPTMKGGRGSPAATADPATGSFDLGPYPPGEYQLSVRAAGYPAVRWPWRALGPDAVWDLGTITLQRGGIVDVALVGSDAVQPDATFAIHDTAGELVATVDVEDGRGRAGPLAPGDYLLQVAGAGIACRQQPFTIRAGATVQVDVHVKKGVLATIALALPDSGVPLASPLAVTVRDAAGVVVLRTSARVSMELPAALLPGRYRIEAGNADLAGRAELNVVAPGPARAALTLERRR